SFPLHNINQQRKGLKPSPTARAVSRSPLDDSVASASIAGGNIRSLRLSGIRPAAGRPWPSASPRIFVQPQAPAGTSVPLGFRASARRPVGLGHRRRLGSFAGPVTATSQQTIDKAVGGGRRDRTDDLMLAKHALSQLSYAPVTCLRHPGARLPNPAPRPTADQRNRTKAGGPG